MENTSKIYKNGSVWNTKTNGDIEIIEKSDKRDYYICKNSKNEILNLSTATIRNGKKIEKMVYDVGIIGDGEWRSYDGEKITREYNIWSAMLCRCYSTKYLQTHSTYRNCTVCNEWLNFQNFCNDIRDLENYNEWINDNNYQLDKDIKQQNIKCKIYSKNTCIFVKKSDNIIESNHRQKTTGLTYIGIRIIDNYREEFINQSEFARKYNLKSYSISKCILKKAKTCYGWRFEIKI